ncbi:MAG: methylmalonyl-CoA epimerase, partial [Anaerolineae bacterium]|nr:methylmalonyl-CoA epimerase [Anaerolineae bacterium]
MATIKKVNHIAVAVPDIEEALKFWRDGMGIDVHHIEDVPSQKAKVAFLPVGDTEVELV